MAEPFEDLFLGLPLNSCNHQLCVPRSEVIHGAGLLWFRLPKQPCFPHCALYDVYFTEITLSSKDSGSFCKPLNSCLISFETFDSDYAISQKGRFDTMSDFHSKLFVLYGLKQDLG